MRNQSPVKVVDTTKQSRMVLSVKVGLDAAINKAALGDAFEDEWEAAMGQCTALLSALYELKREATSTYR